MEWFVTIFIFFGVIAVTAVLFGGWLLIAIIRLIFRGIAALFDSPHPLSTLPAAHSGQLARCGNPRCRNLNPPAAHFCRRCGSPMPAAQRVTVQRAAMW